MRSTAGGAAPETIDLGELSLRRPRASDAPAIHAYANDPEVARYADWPLGNTVERIAESIGERKARWDAGEEFYWVIATTMDDRVIGGVTCHVIEDAAEVGFLLHRGFWGRGIATKACRAVVEWALTVHGLSRVWATCDTENQASVRVLEKAGLVREGLLSRRVIRPNIGPEPRDAFLYSRVRGGA